MNSNLMTIMDISKVKGAKFSAEERNKEVVDSSNEKPREDGAPRCLAFTKGTEIRCSLAARERSDYCNAHKRWSSMSGTVDGYRSFNPKFLPCDRAFLKTPTTVYHLIFRVVLLLIQKLKNKIPQR